MAQLLDPAAFERPQSNRLYRTPGKHANSKEQLYSTYERLKQRRRKLDTLRYGLNTENSRPDDSYSMHSEATDLMDRKSPLFANAYFKG